MIQHSVRGHVDILRYDFLAAVEKRVSAKQRRPEARSAGAGSAGRADHVAPQARRFEGFRRIARIAAAGSYRDCVHHVHHRIGEIDFLLHETLNRKELVTAYNRFYSLEIFAEDAAGLSGNLKFDLA